ncbi:prolyl 4-hydroxylase subunit alpha-1 [Dermacentor silvarum]|uniref:prolyl 4-hydroxylase subunit alpha-1 n=1 Tax=Dermacentor silvarum TaxID=543639 RepID=UPI0018978D79|nr:prolyl 4-hydroxylase subunit alpha-1 [Dermacentor silvarum]
MQKCMVTEHITLEDGHFYVLLQERNLATAISRYETFQNVKSLRQDQNALVSWLRNLQHRILERVTRRIEVATDLSLESAESYQVVNYGIGGHYTPHMDAHGLDKITSYVDIHDGNRLATMLMYLTDVEAGGATAFVKLGIAVKPRIGDALFWYDVKPYDGNEFAKMSFWHQKRKADELTTHVACPVLWGSKWIVTKWIRERNNFVVHYNTPG